MQTQKTIQSTQAIEMSGNYVNMISHDTLYTESQVLDAAEKKYGQRPISCKKGTCIPATKHQYLVTYWVFFK